MQPIISSDNKQSGARSWAEFSKRLLKYSHSNTRRSIWQIANTFVPYVGLWVLIIYSLSVSLWLTAFLIVLAAGFLVRLFIIFHDCGHGSFFNSKKANRIVGMFFGILAFTPYDKWHNQHMKHHATVGNLDQRGVGDVWTMTKEEFENSDNRTRLKYKIYRNPFVMFGLGPLAVFLVTNRFTYKWMTRKEKQNIWFTNAALVVIFVAMGFAIGFIQFLIIQLLILNIAAIAGFWLFYLQHQYEDVEWYRQHEWDFKTVALHGSSYLKFPKLLQWFSGNIGFHHIHHMNARIPNYKLEKCYRENQVFQTIKPVTFYRSLKALKLRLWDEKSGKLVTYRN